MKLDSPSSPRFVSVFSGIVASALCVNCLSEPEVIFTEEVPDDTTSGSGGSAAEAPDEEAPDAWCVDLGYGFNAEGQFVEQRDSQDVPVPGRTTVPWTDFELFANTSVEWNCHAGDAVTGTTLDDSLIPEALGGELTQGTYVLTYIAALESPAFDIEGNTFHQTLYVTSTSLGLDSDDNHIFTFTGAYLFDITGTTIVMNPLRQTYNLPEHAPFTDVAEFTATADEITLISQSRGYVAKYSKVPDLTISSDSGPDEQSFGQFCDESIADARTEFYSSRWADGLSCTVDEECQWVQGMHACFGDCQVRSGSNTEGIQEALDDVCEEAHAARCPEPIPSQPCPSGRELRCIDSMCVEYYD